MLNSKQRAKLRSLANTMETILQIGKGGITKETVKQAEDALKARELIKCKVLETAPYTVREAAEKLSGMTAAETVQTIGTKFVLYKQNPEKPVIVLK